MSRVQLVGQNSGPDAEYMVEKTCGLSAAAEAVIERIQTGAALCRQPTENAVIAQERKDLAGHMRKEALNSPASDKGMFAVRSGEDKRRQVVSWKCSIRRRRFGLLRRASHLQRCPRRDKSNPGKRRQVSLWPMAQV